MSTPKERAASIIENQGDDLSRYQRMFLAQDIEKEIAEAVAEAQAPLLAALNGMINMYAELVNSGDCGSWDVEKMDEVIAARAAIAKAKGE